MTIRTFCLRSSTEDPGGSIVIQSWGLFLFVHFLYNQYFGGGSEPPFPSYLLTILGLVLLIRARGEKIFLASVLLAAIDSWLQMPVSSNHAMLKLFVIGGILVSCLQSCAQPEKYWSDRMSVVARYLLCGLYFFGVFHKINKDFLDPTVSCAVALWGSFPFNSGALDSLIFQYLLVYGILIVEGVILAGLLFKTTRRVAIATGIALHSLIVLSNFDNYIAFSTLSIFLHIASLSPATRVSLSDKVGMGSGWARNRKINYLLGLSVWLVSLTLASLFLSTSLYGALWLFWVAWLVVNVSRADVSPPVCKERPSVKWSSVAALLLGLLFFANNWAPYTGWKNAQSMNMFANLIYEDGISNHLILKEYKTKFPYLNNTVKILSVSGNPELAFAETHEVRLAYVDFLQKVQNRASTIVTYERAENIIADATAESLSQESEANIPPEWITKIQVFRPITLQSPKACTSYY